MKLNVLVGGVGVPQQWPWDVLGGLLWLPPGWSYTCTYWSTTVSQGKKTLRGTCAFCECRNIYFFLFNYKCVFGFVCVCGAFRTQVSARWGSCSVAVVLVLLWPVRSVWRVYPRHPLGKYFSLKVSKLFLKWLNLINRHLSWYKIPFSSLKYCWK